MKLYVRMCLKEGGDFLCFVGREVVQNHVDVLSGFAQPDDLIEKIDKFITGVTGCCLAMDLSAANIQCGIERERAVMVVFEAVTLGSSR